MSGRGWSANLRKEERVRTTVAGRRYQKPRRWRNRWGAERLGQKVGEWQTAIDERMSLKKEWPGDEMSVEGKMQ